MPKRTRDQADPDPDPDDLPIGDAPTSINPYTTLSLEPTATADEIKKAYRRAALRHHPDKALPADRATAHVRFQEIAFAFAILSDPQRRRRYDLTGRTDESLYDPDDADGEAFDWAEFYRAQFAETVTADRIARFAEEYRGSSEERRDVLRAYERCGGKMGRVYEEVMLSDVVEDEERFRGMIEAGIAAGEVEALVGFTGESVAARERRVERARRKKVEEAREVEEEERKEKEKKGKETKKTKKDADGGMGDLAALIQQRQKGRSEDFFARLEEKYAPKKGKKQKGPLDEPPEEAFAKNAAAKKSASASSATATAGSAARKSRR